jgi:cytosine/adenosine deaminase-related metal-dependent hydrolase
MKFGTTLIGDIAAEGASYHVVTKNAVRAVLFWEVIGLNQEKFDMELKKIGISIGDSWDPDAPLPPRPQTNSCRWAMSPHSPYSAHHHSTLAQLYYGSYNSIHLAESPGEIELLDSKTGKFVLFLKELGVWDSSLITARLLDYLKNHLPSHKKGPALFIHCNYLPQDAPFASNQSIVFCPRTHAAFRHPPHPFREFLERGVRVCLGTDSLASNPDLDILAEARFVHGMYPDFSRETLLKMITLAGAEALGWANETGSLEPGKSADFVAVPLPDRHATDPHQLLFADYPAIRRTMFRGEWR